jgi:hypothetical protein
LNLGTITTTRLCGVAAESIAASAAGAKILVHNLPYQVFEVQASGAAVALAKLGDLCDLGGASGGFTADLSAAAYGALKIVGISDGAELGNFGIVRVILARHQLTREGATTDDVTLENGNIIANPAGGTVTVDADFQPTTLTSTGLVKGGDLECTDDLTVGDAIVAAKYNLPVNTHAAKTGTFDLAILASGIVPINNAAPVVIQFSTAANKGAWTVCIQKATDAGNTVKFDVDSSGGDLSYAGAGDITLSGAADIGKCVTVVCDGTKFFIGNV